MDNVVSFDQVLLVIAAKASFGAGQVSIEGSLQVGQFANREAAEKYAAAVKKLLEDALEPTIDERRERLGNEPLPGIGERRVREVRYVTHSVMELPRNLGLELPAVEATESPSVFAEQIPQLLADLLLENID